MTYKLKTNLKRFHEYFTTNLDRTRHIKKNHALLFKCVNENGIYEEVIVARLWREEPKNWKGEVEKNRRGDWKVEIWHEGNCVLGTGTSKGKAAHLAKFVLSGAKKGEPLTAPKFVWC